MAQKIVLCGRQQEVVDAWKYQFEELPEVEIVQGDLFDQGGDAWVVPGNAFGFLDRGLELQLCEKLGWELQDQLRERIREGFFGELLVGQAAALQLEAPRYLVYVAASRTPTRDEASLGAYLGARGAFQAIREHCADAERVVVPGFLTGSSQLHPMISARQIRYAYEVHSGARGFGDKNLTQLGRRELKLRRLPKSMIEGSKE